METARARALVWQPPFGPGLFEPTEFKLKADGPLGAVGMGLSETRRVMLMTYMTFVRLFQGTVKVEHLKGPVGIAQLGTVFAERGWVWLMFFMALVSINLAVINFLPIPVLDGGHMVFLAYEGIRGKPADERVFGILTMIGFVLLLTLMVFVFWLDIQRYLLPN